MKKIINKLFAGSLLAGMMLVSSCAGDYLDTAPTITIITHPDGLLSSIKSSTHVLTPFTMLTHGITIIP